MNAFLLLAFLLVLNNDVGSLLPEGPHNIESAKNIFSIASYNTWGLPIRLPGHNQGSRYKRIPGALIKTGVDILCLQETFSKRLRYPLIDSLSRYFYSYSDYTCNKTILGPWVKDCYGGLMTWSKYPIIDEVFVPFAKVKGMNIEERIGGKGFLISSILKGTQLIYVINTHLYAGMDDHSEFIRQKQIKQLEQFLNEEPYRNTIILLAGDFNITHPNVASMYPDIDSSIVYKEITNELEFKDSSPQLDESGFTIDHRKNIFQEDDKPLQRLDYIFYRNGNNGSSICVENQGLYMHQLPLSDHLGWRVQLSISDHSYSYSTIDN